MIKHKNKLELTWVGKDKRPKLEPRILLEEPDKSYHAKHRVTENDIFDNKLIFGDNLLALKALEQEYAGKIKCVYIDPPFNTGQAFDNYDDGLEHSIWLSLLRDRLECLYRLLRNDGTIFIHIDDNELGYLITLMDEVFGRNNKISIITFKQGAATGHKSINPGLVTTTNFIVAYAKNKTKWQSNRVYTTRDRDARYSQFITNYDDGFENWKYEPLSQAVSKIYNISARQLKKHLGEKFEQTMSAFVITNAAKVIRTARPDYKSVGQHVRDAIDYSKTLPSQVVRLERDEFSDMYFKNGERLLFYKDKLKEVDGELVSGEPLTNLWDDLLSNNLHKEGAVKFPKGKKPEALIKRILELTTAEGDLILDSFAGSGTTASTAHKLKRKWITIELGEHCHTHVLPRIQRVVDGVDQDGVSKAVNWQGGGGFRYYKVAPSLLERDHWGRWIVNKEYNPEMLTEAVCKLEGFTFAPSDSVFWQQGYSTETDFIYVTTQTLSLEQLQVLADEVGKERTLLVCCSAFRCKADRFANLTLKKIPKMVLNHCEWGHDDYSLNVENLPQMEVEEELGQIGLFDDDSEGGAS